jgi:two-component system LytT family response regulator
MNGSSKQAPLRAAIIDDEPLSRRRVIDLLAGERDVKVVLEHAGGSDIMQALAAARPELLFIDVEMPYMNGFEIIDSVKSSLDFQPDVVFVTAFEAHAVRAFEARAIDYLLKPFERARFAGVLDHVRRRRLDRNGSHSGYVRRLAIRNGQRLKVVQVRDIDYVVAQGNYVRLHLGKDSLHFRTTLSELEMRLDPEQFIRIHRSTIVNVDRIASLESTFHRDLLVSLHDGTVLRLSAAHREQLEQTIAGV